MLRPALLSPAFPSGMVTLHLVSSEERRAIENEYTLAGGDNILAGSPPGLY